MPDTIKQQRLAWHLARAGFDQGWRAWIRQRRAAGLSAQAIAFEIHALTQLTIDQSTINLWIKQAERGQQLTKSPPETRK